MEARISHQNSQVALLEKPKKPNQIQVLGTRINKGLVVKLLQRTRIKVMH